MISLPFEFLQALPALPKKKNKQACNYLIRLMTSQPMLTSPAHALQGGWRQEGVSGEKWGTQEQSMYLFIAKKNIGLFIDKAKEAVRGVHGEMDGLTLPLNPHLLFLFFICLSGETCPH